MDFYIRVSSDVPYLVAWGPQDIKINVIEDITISTREVEKRLLQKKGWWWYFSSSYAFHFLVTAWF
jgi:hypothetical protein